MWLASTSSRFDSEKLRNPPLRIHSTLPHIKMKHCIYILFGLIFTGCNPFHADKILKNESELIEIFDFMKEYDNVTLEIESDDRLADKMRRLDIDYVVKKC